MHFELLIWKLIYKKCNINFLCTQINFVNRSLSQIPMPQQKHYDIVV
jgi:hypothetical protein